MPRLTLGSLLHSKRGYCPKVDNSVIWLPCIPCPLTHLYCHHAPHHTPLVIRISSLISLSCLCHAAVPLGAIPEGVDLPSCGETGFTSTSSGCSTLPTSGLTSTTAHKEFNWLQLLLPPQESKQPKVFVGEGLPSILAKLQESILRWEYIDFADLRPLGASGFEVSNPATAPKS